ncbi:MULTISPECIES: DUF72 domain-containing protein [Caballeronia]|uniref:DUF72 domain-containing protein n=1 Tax=Caballeronia TaxID=1827195 RepID=UPI001FD28106|nr:MULTISPECIES: DUF72 domain-containing protein [Caballeronia]MDR5799011.1 DUF72 domain-containing protein [Caballeronia sp. LZ001]
MKIEVGTASWTDPTLIACKRFYPPGCTSAEARLRHYATQFPMVEVDSSYYAMPSASNSALWAERTPPHFTFNLKAFRLFTGHQTDRSKLPKDIQAALPPSDKKNLYYKDTPGEILRELWKRFTDAIEPLRAAGKLGAVHFQFAPWVVNNADGRAHVEHCADVMADYVVATEFRHASWFSEKSCEATLAFERARRLVNVIVDEPNTTSNSIPAVWEVTNSKLALVRLHGRNHETWNIKGATSASARFNYDYTDQELGELASQIILIARKVERAQVVFNNNFEDQGQRNARSLMQILGSDAIPP